MTTLLDLDDETKKEIIDYFLTQEFMFIPTEKEHIKNLESNAMKLDFIVTEVYANIGIRYNAREMLDYIFNHVPGIDTYEETFTGHPYHDPDFDEENFTNEQMENAIRNPNLLLRIMDLEEIDCIRVINAVPDIGKPSFLSHKRSQNKKLSIITYMTSMLQLNRKIVRDYMHALSHVIGSAEMHSIIEG